jgi:hypothetical protein
MIVAVSALVLAAGSAGAGTVVISGTADPFLAGASSGNSVSFSPDTGLANTDFAPAESPVGIALKPGETVVTISDVTGTVLNYGGPGPASGGDGPTGGGDVSSDTVFANGFIERVSGFTNLPINSLVGVFYDPSSLTNTVFEIGSGGSFAIPVGATELYLGTIDEYQWNNNSGAFTASVSVPEPAAWALMLAGFGGLGVAMRARRKTATA